MSFVPAAVAILWGIVLIIPYLVIGETWGTVWFLLNWPLAEVTKPYLFPIGLILYVGIVTVTNVAGVYGILWLIFRNWSAAKRRDH